MSILFLSDLHINPYFDSKLDKLLECVYQEQPTSLYLLGDVFDRWIGWDIDPEYTEKVKSCFHQIANIAPIYFMVGNHDRLIQKHHMHILSAEWLPDPSILRLGNKEVYLTHGDMLCTDDTVHQRFTKLLKKPIFSRLLLSLPTKWRQRFCAAIVKASTRHKTQIEPEKMDLNPEAIDHTLSAHQCDMIIHGHTHKPKIHGPKRITLPAWDHDPLMYLKYDGEFQIITMAAHQASCEESVS